MAVRLVDVFQPAEIRSLIAALIGGIMQAVEKEEAGRIEASARAAWQTPTAVTTEFVETQGLLSSGGDLYASSSGS